MYTSGALDTTELDSVGAQGKADANVIIKMPADQSVFPVEELTGAFKGARIPLADPVQMIWGSARPSWCRPRRGRRKATAMATEPLNRVALAARSVADDPSYVALADIAGVLNTRTTEYRIIGGLMVTALAARWDLGARLYRETGAQSCRACATPKRA